MALTSLKYTSSHVAQSAYKCGGIVIVRVAGELDTSISTWGTLVIGTGLPAATAWMSESIVSQDATDQRAILTINEDGTLKIESKGSSVPKSWMFATLVYATNK